MAHLLQLWVHASQVNAVVPNPYQLLFGAICFLGVFGLAGRILVPRITGTVQARTDAIDGGLQHAVSVNAEAAELLANYRALQAEARHEAAEVRRQALAQGARYLAEQREEAQFRAGRMVTAARAQLAAERENAVASLRPDVDELAVELASRIVGEPLHLG
jgi:F-type H+-transporting ATPase subunit b